MKWIFLIIGNNLLAGDGAPSGAAECGGPLQPSEQDAEREESGRSAAGLDEEGQDARHLQLVRCAL